MQKGNLVILVLCQLISATGSIVIVTLGGIIGSALASNLALSTLPISMMVVAVALTTVPATVLMRKIGRSRGFALASVSAAIALVLASLALQRSSFELFVLAAMLFGVNMAFTQQYRYAAAESVPSRYVPRAVSLVLLGSIGGALLGPVLVIRGQFLIENVTYAGTLFIVAALYILQGVLLLRLRGISAHSEAMSVPTNRALPEIVFQPIYLVAVLGGTVGYGLMTLVMTATPLGMHVMGDFSLEQTSGVISAHVLSMYLPSLVSGFLIERFGVTRLMFAGALILLVTSIVGLQGQTLMHYWWALVMLGVGWNFLYVGGTTMLTYTYSLEERFRAQAVNEFLVFGLSAIASLLAGTVMHYFGWFKLMLIPIPILILICLALLFVRRDPLLRRGEQAANA
ncbi:MAG: MFS transporter [Gammaproteobacteria bacterium]|nr:MFS transporter [Gammaproteobacteria bacterium]